MPPPPPAAVVRNVALAERLRARGAELAAAHGGCTHRLHAFTAAAEALRNRVPFDVDAASLARLPLHAHARGADGKAPPPGWTGLRCGDAPLDELHAALGAPPPQRLAGLALKPPPGPEPEPQPGSLLVASPLLARILALLPPAALVRASCTCRAMQRAAFSAPGLPSAAKLRVMTWCVVRASVWCLLADDSLCRNIKNNGEDRHSGQPRGEGCQVWEMRRGAVAAALAAQAPAVLCLQEDKDSMLTGLFATADVAHTTLRCFPQPGERVDAPVLSLQSDSSSAEQPPPPGSPTPWERCCILWDDALLERVHAGQYRWHDGRSMVEQRKASDRVHFLPMTWMLLRWRTARPGGGLLLVLNAHIEAGHHWNTDMPAKRRSAVLFTAAASALRARFGSRVPVLAGGDWNMQKTQLHYKVLVGASQIGILPEYAPPARRAAAARVPMPIGASAPYDAADGPLAGFVDVFDAWLHDCPHDASAPSVPAPFGTVGAPAARIARTGGHDGTTWHAFKNARSAEETSNAMRDDQIQHISMADGEDGGARGHQRHIDAIMLCAAASAQGSARVRSAWVLKRRAQCGVTGGCALLRLRGGDDEDDDVSKCCHGKGGWGSDHFPIVADITLFFSS